MVVCCVNVCIQIFISMADLEKVLRDIYYNRSGGPASLAGVNAVHLELEKRLGKKIPKNLVKNWLRQQYTYLRHKQLGKPKGKRHATVPIIRTNVNQTFDCDLAQFDKSRFKWGLVCADVFSSKIYMTPMVRKTAKSTAAALERMIKTQARGKFPAEIRSDYGSEFHGEFSKILKQNQVKQSFTDANQKSAHAEAAIGRFRNKLEKRKTLTNRNDWTEHWRSIIKSMNATPSARVKIAPDDISEKNAGTVFERKFGKYLDNITDTKELPYSVGTPVRISLTKSSIFSKGSKPAFSAETFLLVKFEKLIPSPIY